jgi:hypothetical protein
LRGIFAVDPGAQTGLAWGIVDDSKTAIAIESMAKRIYHGSETLKGSEAEQIRRLFHFWTTFKRRCVFTHLLEPDQVDLVIEDFVLYPGEKPGKATTTPERIAWGFEGYRMASYDDWRRAGKHYSPIHWQKSAAASRFYKDRKLMELANAWFVGREHERSALGHMILRLNVILDKN